MQITHVHVIPLSLKLHHPYQTARHGLIKETAAVFICVETRQGKTAWGCTAFIPTDDGPTLSKVTRVCRACADRALELNPLNIEHALSELAVVAQDAPAALCAFDIAFYDLLALAAGLPLYRLLGGYRRRIQTSITLGLAPVRETVEMARDCARQGFRMIKLKGGLDPRLDVERARAVADALPNLVLRIDAEEGYTVPQALDVTRSLEGKLEFIEQPTAAHDLEALGQVTHQSTIPVLADESIRGPSSALHIASHKSADGLNVKLAACGGLHCARQIDAIARAAHCATMVGCINEPALLIAAGLSFALSSPNVHYGDLDGHLFLNDDPTRETFELKDGWLTASDVPGLGCRIEL